MEGDKIFYIKYPRKEIMVNIVILAIQPLLLLLVKNTVFIIIWFNLIFLFFGYHLLKIFLVNIYNHSYILFNKEGIRGVNPFNKITTYSWNNFSGYILINNVLIIQFGTKNLKIVNDFLKNGNINEIIALLEEYKVNVKYDIQ